MSGLPQFESHPQFYTLFNLVVSQNPLQRKRIEAFLNKQEETYWNFAEELCTSLNYSLLTDETKSKEAARAYNHMCMDILREQIRFKKTGVYLNSEAAVANETVYSNPEVMQYYIVGLLLSYLFWPNHYQMWDFFVKHLSTLPQFNNCLEVGVGHGLFTREILHRQPELNMTVMDISETSLNLAKQMLHTFLLDQSNVNFYLGDFLKTSINEKYDFIILGEVLEHVDNAPTFMQQTRKTIQPNGHVFISTCANCPAVDHIYHFHNADEIRSLLTRSGFSIENELVLAAEAISESMWEEEKVTLNYCAILSPN